MNRSSDLAKTHLVELIKITKSSPRSLLLYAVYAREVSKDQVLEEELYKIAKSSFTENRNEPSVAIFTISGDETTLGLIQDASENTELLFGYKSHQLVGKNIDFLCPEPFGNGVHARFLRHYIENAVSFVPIQRRIWARHVKGYAMKMDLAITPEQDELGNLTFQGKLSLVSDSKEFIMVDSTGDILFFSQGVLSDVGSISEHQNIQQCIPSMASLNFDDSLNLHDHLICLKNGEKYLFDLKSMKFPSAGISLVALEYSSKKTKKHVKTCDAEEMPSVRMTLSKSSDKSEFSVLSRRSSTMLQVVNHRIVNENRRLVRFNRQCKLLCLVCTFMVLVSIVSNNKAYNNFTTSLQTMLLAGERSYLILETAASMLHQYTSVSTNTSTGTIGSNADRLEILHQLLKPAGEYQEIVYDPHGAIEYFTNHKTEEIGVDNLMLRYIANSRAFLDEDQTTCGASCQFVINNGAWELQHTYMQLLNLYSEQAMADLRMNQHVNGVQLTGGATFLTLVLMFLIIPHLHDVKRVKQELVQSLRQIDKRSIRQLANAGQNIHEEMKQEIMQISSSSNPFQSRVHKAFQSTMCVERQVQMPRESKSWFGFKKKSKVAPRTQEEIYIRESEKRLFRSFIFTTLELALPLLLIFTYFIVVYHVAADLRVNSTRIMISTRAKTIRLSAIQQFRFSIAKPNTVPEWSRWYSNPEKYNETARGFSFLNKITELQNAVTYGNNEGTGSPMLEKESNPQAYHLEYVNMCDIVSSCAEYSYYSLDTTVSMIIQHGSRWQEDHDEEFLSSVFKPVSEAIQMSITYFIQRAEESIKSAQNQLVIGGAFTFLLIFIVLRFMSHTFKHINDQVVAGQSLLLLLTPEMIDSVPALKAMISGN